MAEEGTVDEADMTEAVTAGRPILGEALHMEVEEVMGVAAVITEDTKIQVMVEVMGAATKAHIFHVGAVEAEDADMAATAVVAGEIHIKANTELVTVGVIDFHPTTDKIRTVLTLFTQI